MKIGEYLFSSINTCGFTYITVILQGQGKDRNIILSVPCTILTAIEKGNIVLLTKILARPSQIHTTILFLPSILMHIHDLKPKLVRLIKMSKLMFISLVLRFPSQMISYSR